MIEMKQYFYLFLVFIIIACQIKDKKFRETEKFLNEFSKGVSERFPPQNSNLLLYFKLDDNSIIEINNIQLYNIYKRQFKDKFKFSEFLYLLFNEKIQLKRNLINQSKRNYINIKPKNDINLLKSKELFNKYCDKSNDYLILKNRLNNEVKFVILYNFFREKKYISFDDYQGYYIIKDNLR